MTRRDFIGIAEALWLIDKRIRLHAAKALADFLQTRNSRFQRQRFIDHAMMG